MQEALTDKQEEADFWREELKKTHASWTYRLGRVVTWLPRKVRSGMHRFKELIQ